MARTQIQFTEAQLERLRRTAEREGTSVSDVVRRAVDASVATGVSRVDLRARALAAAGLYASGDNGGAVEHDRHQANAFRS